MFYHSEYTKYSVDEKGTIFGPKGLIRPFLHHTGYLVFTARKENKQKQFRAHRFIMECLLGKSCLLVNHKDGDKTNNNPSNLEYVTPKQNTRHAFLSGLMKGFSGETNSMAKLTNEQAKNLICDLKSGLRNKELGSRYGLHPNYVSLIRSKKRWKKLWDSLETSETIRKEYASSEAEAPNTVR